MGNDQALALWNYMETLKDQIDTAETARYNACQQWAALICPIKVGDVVEVPSDAWSHRGKKAKVVRVYGVVNGRCPRVHIHATVLKKDGSEGALTADWSWYPQADREALIKALANPGELKL